MILVRVDHGWRECEGEAQVLSTGWIPYVPGADSLPSTTTVTSVNDSRKIGFPHSTTTIELKKSSLLGLPT